MSRRQRVTVAYETPLCWPHIPCGLHYPVWTDERLEFVGREYTSGTPWEIIDRCALDMDGDAFTPDELDELIEARGWERPPDWDEELASEQWHDSLGIVSAVRGGLGPFGLPDYTERGGMWIEPAKVRQ